jgi:hypothetical protein
LESLIKKSLEDSGCINLIYDEPEAPGGTVGLAGVTSKVSVALDSGATANVIGLEDLPEDVEPTGPPGKPFTDASGGDIKKHGKCDLLMKNADTKVGCRWTACEVTRPLQSVSSTAGPEEGPGLQDVLFNNRLGVVMPPGIVDMILKHIKPVATYPRRGGLYVCDLELSSFPRQGQAR